MIVIRLVLNNVYVTLTGLVLISIAFDIHCMYMYVYDEFYGHIKFNTISQ